MLIKSKVVTGINGKSVRPGDKLELSDELAKKWIDAGWGEAIKEKTAAPKGIAKSDKSKGKR